MIKLIIKKKKSIQRQNSNTKSITADNISDEKEILTEPRKLKYILKEAKQIVCQMTLNPGMEN